MKNTFHCFGLFIWKDLYTEIRALQFLISGISFGVLLLFIMGIALDAVSNPPVDWAAGLLWLGLLFSIVLQMNRHDSKDREMGGALGMFLIPIDRSVLFYTKWISTSVFVLILEIIFVPMFFVILNESPPALPFYFLFVMVAGAVGLTGIGTFLASLTAASSMRDILLPLLLFPMAIPLFLALIRLTVHALDARVPVASVWLDVLIGYLVVFTVLPSLLYETLMEV